MNTSKLDVTVRVLPLGILLDSMERLRRQISEQVQGLQDELDKARAESAEWQAKYDALPQTVSSATPQALEQQLQALAGKSVTVEYWDYDQATGGGSIETVFGVLSYNEFGWHVSNPVTNRVTVFGSESVVCVESVIRNALCVLGLDLKHPVPGRPKGSLNRSKRDQ